LILDDVWAASVLEPLIFKIPGCKILVVSRIKFPPSIIDCIYDLELLREDEAMPLFCHFAFGHNSFPRGFSQKLVKEVLVYVFGSILVFLCKNFLLYLS